MTTSLKEDQLVLISADDGSLPIGSSSPLGLYYHDTQFLSGYQLRVNGSEPLLLSSNTEQNYVATFQLMQSEGAVLGAGPPHPLPRGRAARADRDPQREPRQRARRRRARARGDIP